MHLNIHVDLSKTALITAICITFLESLKLLILEIFAVGSIPGGRDVIVEILCILCEYF